MVATQRTPDLSLRRAAILLSNLDADNRRRLLSHLSPQDASRLRAAAASLADVDPLEVRRTVSAFVGRISAAQQQMAAAPTQAPPSTANSAPRDPANPASAAGPASASAGGSPGGDQAAESRSGLKFLNDVSDTTLIRAIGSEHPQTIAVVLASIDPRQAARLLRQLDPQLRSEAVRRLSRLEEVPQDVIGDIGRHLRGLIGTVDQVASGEGRRLLTSIFSELGADDREALGATLAATDGGIAAALADAEIAQPRTASQFAPRAETATDRDPPAGREEKDGERGGEPTESHSHGSQTDAESDGAERVADRDAGPRILPLESAGRRADDLDEGASMEEGAADAMLESLPSPQLREILAELTAREALLTLCGLSPRCVRRLLRTMPRRAAKDVRQRIHSLGPIDLSEIARAKRKAAAIAEVRTARQAA